MLDFEKVVALRLLLPGESPYYLDFTTREGTLYLNSVNVDVSDTYLGFVD
jgi:hypothetical protein